MCGVRWSIRYEENHKHGVDSAVTPPLSAAVLYSWVGWNWLCNGTSGIPEPVLSASCVPEGGCPVMTFRSHNPPRHLGLDSEQDYCCSVLECDLTAAGAVQWRQRLQYLSLGTYTAKTRRGGRRAALHNGGSSLYDLMPPSLFNKVWTQT